MSGKNASNAPSSSLFRREKALQVCGSQGVEAAMEWLGMPARNTLNNSNRFRKDGHIVLFFSCRLLAHADEAMDTNEPVPLVIHRRPRPR
uniref:Putative sapk substrate protein 1-a n=1 Tax=Ixodes ricinus TaxID=34613 RepID=A0A0K8RDT1_IXORI